MTDLTHIFVTINNIRMHIVTAGSPDGPLVVLLHGFPECWYSWTSSPAATFLIEGSGCSVREPGRGQKVHLDRKS